MVWQLHNLLVAIRNALGVAFMSSKAPLRDKRTAFYSFTALYRKISAPIKYTASQHR